MLKKYRLTENKEIVECTLDEWSHTYSEDDKQRVVKQEDVGEYWVSTVFLGIDHRFINTGQKPPILFETMIFKDRGIDLWQERYCTYQEALDGHNAIVERLKNGTQELHGDDE